MCLLRPAAELHYHQGEDFSPEATLGFHDAEAYGLQDTRSDDGNNDGSGDDHTDNDTNLMVEDAAIPSFLLPGGYSEPRQLPAQGVRCPRCAEQGIEQVVLNGKHCPRCGHQC